MEIEVKFGVPDEQVFQRLVEAPTIAGFRLSTASTSELWDLYLDTANWAMQAAGFACRLRSVDTRIRVTLKGLGGASGALHRRQEYEVELTRRLPPQDWPPGPARDLVLRLCGNSPLFPLFEIHQIRSSRLAHAPQDRAVAEVSLNRVALVPGQDQGTPMTFLELEAELLPAGNEDDLTGLAAELQEVWGLRPESRSKYERALAALNMPQPSAREGLIGPPTGESPGGPHLTHFERAVVERLAREREVIARRARLLLAWDDGLSRAALSQQSGLSPRRIRYWLGLFPQVRLGVFPGRMVKSIKSPDAVPVAAHTESGALPSPEALPQLNGELSAAAIAAHAAPSEAPTASVTSQPGPGPMDMGVAARLPKLPGIEADDSMSEAGRKALRFHFERMLLHEPGTRTGDDIEALHDMRVATRRMRAALRIFEPYFEPKLLLPLLKGLRRTGRALGAVRDLDVFSEKLDAYLGTLPEPQRASLDGLVAALEQQRAAARERMIQYLDSGKYRRFVERSGEFVAVDTPSGSGELGGPPPVDRGLPGTSLQAVHGAEPRPFRVRHVVPMSVYERLAEIHGYDEWVTIPDPPLARLHALRIACKRFRYTVEFFVEVLGPDAKRVIKETVFVQDHLGALQDAVVASGILRDYLAWGTWEVDGVAAPGARRQRPDLNLTVVSPGVAAYLAAQHLEMRQLLDAFPSVWQRVKGPEFSQMVAQAVMAL